MLQLNSNQKEAVECGLGPVIVVAGPGSGKTRVITHRITFLVEKLKINPRKILVLSFTRASAIEMKERFIKDNPLIFDVNFGTLHSAFYLIVRNELGLGENSIILDKEKDGIFRYIWNTLNTKYKEKIYPGESTISLEISKYHLANIRNEHYESNLEHSILEFLDLYELEKKKISKIDLDDIVLKCYELLTDNSLLLSKWQNKYNYILVDEFQDINYLQYEILKMLSNKTKNLFVVGDDDQSIYGFRGANPVVMKNFISDFNNTKIIKLNENYRCAKSIITKASRLINNNNNRISKDIIAANKEEGIVKLILCDDKLKEQKVIIDDIKQKIRNGVNPSDIGILCRSRYSFQIFNSAFKKNAIKYNENKNTKSINSKSIVEQDIITYFKLAGNVIYRNDLIKILNKPFRSIYGLVLNKEYYYLEDLKNSYKLNINSSNNDKKLHNLFNHIETYKKFPPVIAANYIYNVIGYRFYIDSFDNIETRTKMNNEFNEIVSKLEEFRTIKDFMCFYEQYGLETDNTNVSGVNITTMHGSKGLEYDYVYLPDLNDGVIPSKSCQNNDDIEEERRLLYVAMTRAKKELYMIVVRNANNKKLTASRFIREISDK